MPIKIKYVSKLDLLAALIRIDKVNCTEVRRLIKKGLYPLCFILGWFGSGILQHVITSICHCVK